MSTVPPLPLSQIINVSVVITPVAAGPTFNQELFVGSSARIPSATRTRLYMSLDDVAVDFMPTDPEYLAAILYFQQKPTPSYLWIGRQDLTAIVTATVASGGTGYQLGDIVTAVQVDGSLGTIRVTAESGGIVSAIQLVSGGTGYTDASGIATSNTNGHGTNLTLDITVGETPLQAVTACQLQNTSWYAVMYVGTASDQDLLDIAEYIEKVTPSSVFFLTTGEASILVEGASPAGNILALLQAMGYSRTFSVYSTTQNCVYPSNIYASAAVLGVISGRITSLPGSYFDVMFKSVLGIGPEPLTIAQVVEIAGAVDRSQVGLNGNVIVEYQNGDIWCQSAVMASGEWFDQVLFLDMLVADMQASGVALLAGSPSIPITDGGVLAMKNALGGACQRSQDMGFIAPSGTWTGPSIGSGPGKLSTGDSLPKGYFLYAPPVSQWPAAQRAKRIMPSVTVALVEAQSGHSLSVTVYVQQ
jgi:hypothetical protein